MTINSNYYLKENYGWWLLSPSLFYKEHLYGNAFYNRIIESGLMNAAPVQYNSYRIRPVIKYLLIYLFIYCNI